MDSEIRITPKVDTTDLKKLDQALTQIEQHMQRLVGVAGKIKIPTAGAGTVFPGSGGSGGSASSPAGATAQAETARAHQAVRDRMPQARRRGSGSGSGAGSSGQFLTNFQNIIEPILPELDVMMKQPGGKTQAAAHLNQHLSHIRSIAAHPAGSQEESFAIANAAQSTGLGYATLANSAAEYRATNPSHGAVITAYLKAHRQAQGSPATSSNAATGVIQKLAGAAGFGEVGSLLGGGLGAAALGVGFMASQTRRGWSNYMAQGTAFSAISKTVGTLGESFNTLRARVDATSTGLAESLGTITAATQATVPYVGNVGTRGLTRQMTASQGLAFSMGLNPVNAAQAFGQAAQIGVLPTGGSVGRMAPAQFAALIANATNTGTMQGRQGQVLSAMLSVSQQIAQQLGQAPNEKLLASIMTNLNQSGNPMLQGTMGAQVLGSINQGIQNPGLGNAGALASYQALNPNGRLGYFQTKFLQAQGLSGTNPLSGVSNFAAELGYFQKMLPGGTVRFTHGRYGSLPTEQTASVSALLGQMWGLSQPQSLNVLKAFNGQTLSTVNRTTQLAQKWGGPQALPHLLSHGGLNVFSEIANARHVGGRYGLNALSHEITGSLHGHVSKEFYRLEHQYQALGPGHAHQQGVIFNHMRRVLGQNVLHGPTLQNSINKLESTMSKSTAAWVRIAKDLAPTATWLAHLGGNLANNLAPLFKHPLSQKAWFNFLNPGVANSAYTLPSGTAQTQPGATLASFVMGNQQSGLAAAFLRSGGSSSHHQPYRNTAWNGPTPTASNLVTRWNPTVNKVLARMPHHNPLLTKNLIDAVITQQSGGRNYLTHVDSNGTSDAGLMQINSSNWASQGLTRQNVMNPTANIQAGAHILNQLLNQYHNLFQAASHYAGSGPQAQKDAAQLLAILSKIEKNTRGTGHYPVNFHGAQSG